MLLISWLAEPGVLGADKTGGILKHCDLEKGIRRKGRKIILCIKTVHCNLGHQTTTFLHLPWSTDTRDSFNTPISGINPELHYSSGVDFWITRADAMSQWPATSTGTLFSKQTFSSYLTSLFEHFLTRERVSESFLENPWFMKTWLEWLVTDSFSHWGSMQIDRSQHKEIVTMETNSISSRRPEEKGRDVSGIFSMR